jgi:hypothetical protein
VNVFDESSRSGPNDILVLCRAGLRGDLPQHAALAVVQMPFGREDQAHPRYAITGTKRFHNFDLASQAPRDSDGVDAGELVTRGCNKNQGRKKDPDAPPEHGVQSHLKARLNRAHSDSYRMCARHPCRIGDGGDLPLPLE